MERQEKSPKRLINQVQKWNLHWKTCQLTDLQFGTPTGSDATYRIDTGNRHVVLWGINEELTVVETVNIQPNGEKTLKETNYAINFVRGGPATIKTTIRVIDRNGQEIPAPAEPKRKNYLLNKLRRIKELAQAKDEGRNEINQEEYTTLMTLLNSLTPEDRLG